MLLNQEGRRVPEGENIPETDSQTREGPVKKAVLREDNSQVREVLKEDSLRLVEVPTGELTRMKEEKI